MLSIETNLGEINITDVKMKRSNGYGQYTIQIFFDFNGEGNLLNLHSTDSKLFDEVNGEENQSSILIDKISYLLLREIENFIYSNV
jgi:hypothetical protein